MPKQRKRYDAAIKAKVALEAIKGQRTITEIAIGLRSSSKPSYPVEKQAIEQLQEIFSNGRARADSEDEELQKQLYEQIGRLKCELDLETSGSDRGKWFVMNRSLKKRHR
jgi:hypothetical protein